MLIFITRRILSSILLLFIISIIGFIIIELPPGDFLTRYVDQLQEIGNQITEGMVDDLRIRYGMDKPIYEKYIIWISHFIQGDFGESFVYGKPVSELVGSSVGYTLLLTFSAMMFAWVVSIPVGIYSATHKYKIGDNIITFITFIGVAIPGFLLALILMLISTYYRGFSVGGLFSQQYANAPWDLAKFIDMLKHLLLPVIITGLASMCGLVRMLRSNVLDIMNQPFVTTARSKGLREYVVIWKHVLKVAINPLISTLGMTLPRLISSAALVSIVLNLPTMGYLYIQSLKDLDMYLSGFFLMVYAFLLIAGNLISDILLTVVDPRIRLE